MIKSNIAKGQMFIQFPQPIAELQDTTNPRVWVKIKSEVLGNHYGEDKEEVSLFVDNNALVRLSIGQLKSFGLRDKWYITDTYYGYNVRKGDFVPIDDLREVDDICIERGCGFPEEVDF